MLGMTGCSLRETSPKRVAEIPYTVVEEADVPKELLEIIDSRKQNKLRLTYATKDYLYIVAGFGEQKTSGYSIRLNDIYLGENAIYMDINLLGPAKSENISQTVTYPYIVVKYV